VSYSVVRDSFSKQFSDSQVVPIDKIIDVAAWLLDDGVKFNNAIISIYEDKDVIVWESGTWQGGIWEKGFWKRGVWIDGLWKTGIWNSGLWLGGLWEYGRWYNGEWLGGIWQDGLWEDGIWYDGDWDEGTWENGTWYSGNFKGGEWEYGEWKDGEWLDGYIKDCNRVGNYDDSWEWSNSNTYVISPISPKEYWYDIKCESENVV